MLVWWPVWWNYLISKSKLNYSRKTGADVTFPRIFTQHSPEMPFWLEYKDFAHKISCMFDKILSLKLLERDLCCFARYMNTGEKGKDLFKFGFYPQFCVFARLFGVLETRAL